ncbi:hypothetical protein DXZ20_36450 [Leptolyngbyaceae cyanobacterium CCMR0081]|uniref:Uncharacterized protein n=1 Tax=Adonisia turfae CCMR0081 TaxID=2292702 RepID=A0A6M0RXX0_9CYAN|nr:hypothetical protein [Adonisia turfae CCMR0081]
MYLVVKNSADQPRGTWIPMGAAWQNSDGKGFSLSIDFLPIRMPGKIYDFVLRAPLDDQSDEVPTASIPEEPDF